MKIKAFLRGLCGIPTGITIGYLITIIYSLAWGKGSYSPCVTPELKQLMGNELNAVILQTGFYALLGLSYSASSVIWEIERWGITKQTIIYFLIASCTMMPVAYFTYWMEHSLTGFLAYFGIFVFIFFVIWLSLYLVMLRLVKTMNKNLN
ncbi:MAG: DUF3021 domain-containing protein [Lachnospiraceae bacterium]|nr:DUF3021 domain-containing protein [Lachnospiraceae bacterium]